jgi:hypothetical protein
MGTREECEDMVADCQYREERLNEWEYNFVEYLSDILDSGWSLTDRQEEVLEKLWHKVIERG